VTKGGRGEVPENRGPKEAGGGGQVVWQKGTFKRQKDLRSARDKAYYMNGGHINPETDFGGISQTMPKCSLETRFSQHTLLAIVSYGTSGIRRRGRRADGSLGI